MVQTYSTLKSPRCNPPFECGKFYSGKLEEKLSICDIFYCGEYMGAPKILKNIMGRYLHILYLHYHDEIPRFGVVIFLVMKIKKYINLLIFLLWRMCEP